MAPAQAQEIDALPRIEYPAGSGSSSFEHLYGAATPAERRIEIGTATRSIRIDTGFEITGASMQCYFGPADGGDISTRTWHPEEWDLPEQRALTVPAGRVVAGAVYELRCETGDWAYERAIWSIVAIEGGAATVAVSPDPAKLVTEREIVALSGGELERRTLTAGELVAITGSPGTWARPGVVDGASITLRSSTGSAELEMAEPWISNDRSTLTFLMHQRATTATLSGDIEIDVRTHSTLAGSDTVPSREYEAWWHTEATLVDSKVSSSVRVALSSEYAVSLRRVTGTARVVVPGTPHPLGTATVVVDGAVVQRIPLKDGAGGKVSFTLPLLPRGTHEVRVIYSGSDGARGSLSPSTFVRVVV